MHYFGTPEHFVECRKGSSFPNFVRVNWEFHLEPAKIAQIQSCRLLGQIHVIKSYKIAHFSVIYYFDCQVPLTQFLYPPWRKL